MTSNTADPEKRRLPAFYALAMAVDAAVALLTGRAIDRYGAGVFVLPGLAGMTQ